MEFEFAIKYIDESNYSVGMFKDGKLNGWGAKVYVIDGIDCIERGYYKDDVLDGIGIIYHFLDAGPQEVAGIFKDGNSLSIDEVKCTISGQEYNFRPNFNGDEEYRDVLYFGTMGEDGYPRGFGMVEDGTTHYYLHYDEEGYRTGLFIYPSENGTFGEYLYSISRTELDKKEWAIIMNVGVGLNIKKLIKKYPSIN